MLMIRDFGNQFFQLSGMPFSNNGLKLKLKQAGINTNSKQYQAVISAMEKAAGGRTAYTSIEAIKNSMRHYDKDGDVLNSHGIAGMDISGKSPSEWHQIINVSERSRQDMFNEVKRHFIQENGVHNGDTTRRTEVFTKYQRSVPKDQRLKGTWTLGQYERQYYQAFYDAAKKADPNWELGMDFKMEALDGITRESVEASLTASGGQLVKKEFDMRA